MTMPKAMSERKNGLALAAACLAVVFTVGTAAWPQSPTLNITVTGQSMIRGDIRVHTPSVVSTIAPLLKGDVIFTNFEATVIEKGQSPQEAIGRFLSPPEAPMRSRRWASTFWRYPIIIPLTLRLQGFRTRCAR